ncbi:MAG: right-handed parallel beta-helix repeat-containing protein [Acidobacteriia bacterium]|nr:right-handed parallel beta-helix repeat-containing protein [Terriglobia bacterium]
MRQNYAHDNVGPGLWTDINNDYVDYENNHTARNLGGGIIQEISYHATIRNNLIEDDGFSSNGNTFWYGAGILLSNSSDVEVYGNTVTNCMNGIGGIQAVRGNGPDGLPYVLQNLYVHDNIVTQQVNSAAGIVKAATLDDSVYTSWGNRFQNTTYYLSDPNQPYFVWFSQYWTLDQWDTYWSVQ